MAPEFSLLREALRMSLPIIVDENPFSATGKYFTLPLLIMNAWYPVTDCKICLIAPHPIDQIRVVTISKLFRTDLKSGVSIILITDDDKAIIKTSLKVPGLTPLPDPKSIGFSKVIPACLTDNHTTLHTPATILYIPSLDTHAI